MAVTIQARPNSSNKVVGDEPITVIDVHGNKKEFQPGEEIFLCRCGCSKNKPYCDSSHKTCGFKDE